jgi:uncharacterized protein
VTVTEADIQAIADTIVRNFNPDRIVLFGSHARGDAGPDSDVDLLVVLPFEGSPIPVAAKIRVALPHTIPFDVLARTREQVEERTKVGDPFFCEVVTTGRILFERAA